MSSPQSNSQDNRLPSEPLASWKPAAEMIGIWKRFPGVVANRGIDLEIRPGEILALLGENGAGKTCLMKVLAGVYRFDLGRICVGGIERRITSPADAIAAGIGMVHQNFRLVEALTAAENIYLGSRETPFIVSVAELIRKATAECERHGLEVDPAAKIWQLSVGEQQRVEILRILSRGAKILILDEPTAVLTPKETQELFRTMRSLSAAGKTVVFISHKLDEVLEISDRVTVLRSGRKVTSSRTADCDARTLARQMIGEEVERHFSRRDRGQGSAVLELRRARATNDRGLAAILDLDLTVREGEILGVAGVAGNGQRELAEVVTGLRGLERGSLLLNGQDHSRHSPLQIMQEGVGHIPEDRLGTGLVSSESVANNAILRAYRRPPITRGFLLRATEVEKYAKRLLDEAGVRLSSLRVPVRQLSGGNSQRLLVRREIHVASRLLVAVHPTRGLDVGATEEVRHLILEHRNRGGGVLLISEDLDEVLLMSDRTVVIYRGRIVGEFTRETANREGIGLLMGGVSSTGDKA